MNRSTEATFEALRSRRPTFWANPEEDQAWARIPSLDVAALASSNRLDRAATLLRALFPLPGGEPMSIHSPLLDGAGLAKALSADPTTGGAWLIKADHQLPVAGSIKARGGFHEVIALAERLALAAGLVGPKDDLAPLASPDARALFSRHIVSVGSTGNLGLSIGLMASALGFRAVVHMSHDAKTWKKERLRANGVEVVEHAGDYASAVRNGRELAARDPATHFVDDEQSVDLFTGYASAAEELARQLAERRVPVDADHPLFVYLPCGVGGAPGGIAYGLKHLFGSAVHCVFAEPVESPCMLIQMMAGFDHPMSVYDLGLSNRTEADGLAVGQASMLVAPLMRSRLAGIYTVSDNHLLHLVCIAFNALGVQVEPSAAAGIVGPLVVTQSRSGRRYLASRGLESNLARSTHVIWTTGGSLVPQPEFAAILQRAKGVAAPCEIED